MSVEIFFKDCHVTPELTRVRWLVGYKVGDDLFISSNDMPAPIGITRLAFSPACPYRRRV
ncbi:hypothetical protein [Rhizobium laguerreae]|uniref:hypothetical protein n=1 Tax=Rhizobium laguerreae TaxID=1076926 RepID=UPI001441895D|nr:hypothetical protein [Rhizobium laguerreae]MBY3253026.1 hypothetical protein [Rhizobium laguerreae]MBY3280215.1 hypothetical protein [Rhizobium laguerreae]NKM42788.1 hypothetical protein [Rhizobium laguerreae]